jgi:hypothetical protein
VNRKSITFETKGHWPDEIEVGRQVRRTMQKNSLALDVAGTDVTAR